MSELGRNATSVLVPHAYSNLRRAVEAVVIRGRREIDQAWLHTYHETGRLIHAHILQHKERADYGARVFTRLSGDVGISKRVLYECVQFYRYFPIVRSTAQLTRSHYQLLCQVGDSALRQELLKEAVTNKWTVDQLEQHVRPINARTADADASGVISARSKFLTPKRGTPGVCKVITEGGALAVDLGFATYRDLPAETSLRAGALVRLDAAGRINAAEGATKADLFTYDAAVLKVVDGDTLGVKVYLEPGRWVKQKLRLRDLDCPEMDTPEGKEARRFTASLVPPGTSVTICTTKPDKYDRYLADVFVAQPEGEVYLNNQLLAHGHAAIKREWEFGDWGEV